MNVAYNYCILDIIEYQILVQILQIKMWKQYLKKSTIQIVEHNKINT